jgi:hypothetical protein
MTSPATSCLATRVSRRDFLRLGAAAALSSAALPAAEGDDAPPDLLIGYTEFRTDLPGGRHANVKTRRAVVVKADGTGRRVLAEELTREAGYATQFVGWSPDGKTARLSLDWKSDEVGKWEEEHKDFRTTGEGVRHDIYLVDLASGKATKQTPVEEKKSELIKNLVHGRSLSPAASAAPLKTRHTGSTSPTRTAPTPSRSRQACTFTSCLRGRRTASGCSLWLASTTIVTRMSSRPTALA